MAETANSDRKTGNLIDEFVQGRVRVKIFDDFTAKNADEKAKLDEKITRICWQVVDVARAAGKDI